jgi:integrase
MMPRVYRPVSGVYEHNPGSGIWYIRYRLNGKLVRKSIGTHQEAVDQLNKTRFIRRSGEGIVAKSAKQLTRSKQELVDLGESNVTISELADQYLAHIQDENNPERPLDQENPPQRLGAIKKAFGDRPAAMIKPYEVTDWLKSLKLAPATLNRYKSTFSAVYRYAKERAKLTVNPVRDVPQFSVPDLPPQYLKPDQEQRLRAVLRKWIDECPDHHRLKKLIVMCHPYELTIAIGTGFRKGNQYRLRWEHCDFENRVINLPKTKNGGAHTIPMIDDVNDALREVQTLQKEIQRFQDEWKRTGRPKPKRLVANGRVFNILDNRSWWEDALEEAGIEDFRWHDLRHTFCSRLSQAGKGLKVIQEAAGHKTIAMSARYAHLDQTTLRNAMTALNNQQ